MSTVPATRRRCGDCGRPFSAKYARWGPCCRWRHRGKPALYVWTPERDQVLRDRYDGRVKGATARLAEIIGWPAWAIKRRASVLGLTHPVDRRDWTEQDTRFLWAHVGYRTAHWMAEKLGRSEASVVLKCKRMRISRRVREGYTLRELELCFGVDHRPIERWVREGKLVSVHRGRPSPGPPTVARRGTRRRRDAWMVSDADLLRFITRHPLAFRLDKVDQTWFMDLVTNGGLLRVALATERKLAAAGEDA